jgi:hypothetical protein
MSKVCDYPVGTILVFSILLFMFRRIDKKIDLMKYEDSQLWSKINLRHMEMSKLESRLELLEKTQGLIFKPAKTEIKHIESRYGRLKLK